MPIASAVLVAGRWIFGDPVCQLDGFVGVFVVYSAPATMGLLAFNRYSKNSEDETLQHDLFTTQI